MMVGLARAIAAVSFVVMASLVFPACSSDAVTAPEPTLYTPGSFVGRQEEGLDWITLYRVLSIVQVSANQRMLLVTLYGVQPKDFEQARQTAERHDLPVAQPVLFMLDDIFVTRPWKVVWFRTLNDTEYGYL